jgi:hypothetical protein
MVRLETAVAEPQAMDELAGILVAGRFAIELSRTILPMSATIPGLARFDGPLTGTMTDMERRTLSCATLLRCDGTNDPTR